jgi:3-hydroxyisobutyrate dehydrogenase-like beta-hydroxyacid dehydrogenase
MEQGLGTWLVAGHGSVGAALARRLSGAGATVLVYDPSPRITVTAGERVSEEDLEGASLDGAMSSVPPRHAVEALRVISTGDVPEGKLFDWNTLPPESKRELENLCGRSIVDVALLDSLDRDRTDTFVAISGTKAASASELLSGLGFDVTVVGDTCGEAAVVKMTRSLFMKSLEALVLEYGAVTGSSSASEVLRRSLERSVGTQCVEFFDLLMRTSRLHAERRAGELVEAVNVFKPEFPGMVMAPAATNLLREVAGAWAESDSPAEDAPIAELMAYLRGQLHGD